MKKFILTSSFAFISVFGLTQHNTVSAGGNASGTGGTVSYSVGQIDYSNQQGTTGSINQGVQQPFEFYLLEIKEGLSVNASLYPNPTNEFIILQIENYNNNFDYKLFDMNGKVLTTHRIESAETHIDMRSYTSGEYLLTIDNQLETIQTIKILKH